MLRNHLDFAKFEIASVWLFVFSGEQGMVDEAQKALEEAEALKKVYYLS